jgi:hypothetical protein
MDFITKIIESVEKTQNIVRVIKAVLAGLEAFTEALKTPVADEK